jgi:hypothetical protein
MKFFTHILAVIATAALGLLQKVFPLGVAPAALGVTCDNLDTINNYFAVAKNQFTEPIYNWIWITNPWVSMFPRSMFDPSEGLVPEVNTTTAEMPTDYPDNLSNLALSNGTGNGACVTSPRVINDGYINRNYRLVYDSWRTRNFCLTDLQFGFKPAEVASNVQKNMQQYATARWADWYRIQNICMVDTKVSTGSGSTYDEDQNSECDFSNVSLPTANLSWSHLNCMYDTQTFLGAEPVGYSEGQPLFALSVGPGIKRQLWQTDAQIRDTVNWGDAFQNFTARGINTSINGFIPNVDPYPIRYAADGTTKIYPWRNTNATVGRKFEKNPNYMTTTRGGSAVYEAFSILPLNVYEVKVRPSGPTDFAGMSFKPQNYVGEAQWINNADMCENIRKNIGFFLFDISMAAKPVRPDVGITGLTLAVDC